MTKEAKMIGWARPIEERNSQSALALGALAGAVGLTVALVGSPAAAAIEKTARLDCAGGQVCLNWWPRLTPPAGWVQDLRTSRKRNIDLLVPASAGAGDDRILLYGRAISRPDGDQRSLDQFIQGDQGDFRDRTVQASGELRTADGQVLRLFRFDPTGAGRWETVAYGEETDPDGARYFLVFALSGASKADREDNEAAFRRVVQAYAR
jgi:hypothetical protein